MAKFSYLCNNGNQGGNYILILDNGTKRQIPGETNKIREKRVIKILSFNSSKQI